MSREKDKGTRAETAVMNWLFAHGFPFAHRNTLRGNKDVGDIGGIPGVVVEVKDCVKMELASWVDEAAREAKHAGVDVFCVVHHRPRKGDVGEWYCTMPVHVFAELIR